MPSEPIHLKDEDPDVDKARIGISYSGGGPLVVIELGVAQAFVDKKIIPAVIAGASAGGIAGTAHALDPEGGRGIAMAARVLGGMTNATVGLDPISFIERAALQNVHLRSIGDHTPLRPLIKAALRDDFGLEDVRVGYFEPPLRPRLLIVATNRADGTSVWLPDEVPIEDALLATSAIPGIFPWQTLEIGGEKLTLVDGGVVDNQPISRLTLEGCGTIFAIAVGYAGGTAPPPTNLVDNAQWSLYMALHQSEKLEEEYVRLKLGDRAVIEHIHPEVQTPVTDFNFTPALVAAVMEEARSKTVDWLTGLGY